MKKKEEQEEEKGCTRWCRHETGLGRSVQMMPSQLGSPRSRVGGGQAKVQNLSGTPAQIKKLMNSPSTFWIPMKPYPQQAALPDAVTLRSPKL